MRRRLSTKTNADYRTDIPEYSDEQLIEILKQRDYYQPEAAQMAIDEAIKREIIYSEQDLFSDEYKVEELETSLFPNIKKTRNKDRIRRSLARSFVLLGILPLVFSFIQTNKGSQIEGGMLFIVGALWIFCSAHLIKQFQFVLIHTLGLLSILGLVYIYAKLLLAHVAVFFDFFLPGILFALLIYALAFLKKINEA